MSQFRNHEISFLQQQNNQVLESLERVETERDESLQIIRACEEKDASLQAELNAVRDKISALTTRIQQDRTETITKDEHLRVLSEQNRDMISMLEAEEKRSGDHADKIAQLEKKNKKLQRIAEEFDVAKAEIEKQVSEAKVRSADVIAGVKSQRGLNETLRANIQNTEAKTRVDIESLGQSLQVVENKNVEYLTRINKQETREQQLSSETETLKEEVEKVRGDIDALRKELEGDQEGRTLFERARSQIETAIEALEVQADTFKKALNTAERSNEQLQEENRKSAEQCRETADKVYALMDSLRLNQVELKKQEAENGARDKKLLSLERQIQHLQAKIAMETDAKVLAQKEKEEAEQEMNLLKKKNRKVEDAVTHSQQEQEKAERAISDANEKVSALQTQNAFLASRIDGQEEEKNSMKAEVKKLADRISEITMENSKFRDDIDRLEEQVATMTSDKQNLQKELEYIKREDVLDEAGRQRPILIQSTESDLLEKLQVNEFLYEAQQARNPVPPLIEKIAQFLAMLHEGQSRADQYLGDLSKSNSLVSALRQRNMALFSKTQMFESFKTRALIRYVMNLVEGDLMTDLHLDGLNFGPREINEMVLVLQRYEATDKVYVVSLIDNGLDEECINLILQMIFLLPYLRCLDLRRNCISQEGIKTIEDKLREMEGVTGVIKTANQVLNVHSGNQLRLTIDMSEQMPKEQVTREVDFTVQQELSADDADALLADSAGTSHHPWTQTAEATKKPGGQGQAMPDPMAGGGKRGDFGGAPGAGGQGASPLMGGPPVGLGGPGNLAALNKKAGKGNRDRVPAPKNRQKQRAKNAPPAVLEYIPNERYIDKWQAGNVLATPVERRPSSSHAAMRRSSSLREPRELQREREPSQHRSPMRRSMEVESGQAAYSTCAVPMLPHQIDRASSERRLLNSTTPVRAPGMAMGRSGSVPALQKVSRKPPRRY
mmetsp:Transcript_110493/g.195581  ORF Transcript_110493/g.195581 Transcript_110493/m.195581 type:complete len:953 (-) Transcript_110493:166-3024(-)